MLSSPRKRLPGREVTRHILITVGWPYQERNQNMGYFCKLINFSKQKTREKGNRLSKCLSPSPSFQTEPYNCATILIEQVFFFHAYSRSDI